MLTLWTARYAHLTHLSTPNVPIELLNAYEVFYWKCVNTAANSAYISTACKIQQFFFQRTALHHNAPQRNAMQHTDTEALTYI